MKLIQFFLLPGCILMCLQIINRIVGFPLLVQLHNHIAGLSSVLTRERQAARIQDCQVAPYIETRLMGVAEHGNLYLTVPRLIRQTLRPHRHAVKVSVSQKSPVISNGNLLFPLQIGKKKS